MFYGIAEGPNENCEDLVHEFLTQTLEIGQMVKIDRAHRLGKPKGRVRPIVVKFHRCIHSYLGVKQGDPSSSLLFMMFVNDIISNINTNLEGIFSVDEVQLFLMLYTDDQVLFSTSPTSLQLMLNDVETYCNAWGLKINVAKTKVLIFEKGNFYTYYDFYLYGEKLEIVTSFKYLGIYFFKNGCWNRSQKCIAEHASKAMHRLFSVFNHYEFSTREKCKLFDTLVSTVLNYSSEIWGLNDGKDIEIVHTKFLRKILCVNKSTNLAGLYGELGRVPLQVIRKINMFRYWIKLLHLDNNNVTKRIYLLLKHDADNNITYNKQNWAYQIKNMLDTLGLGYFWQDQEIADIYLPTIKQRILDQYYQNWYRNINNSRRLSTYCRFKHSFNLKPYLDTIYERKFKIALTRFRLSSHRLEIERGRYFDIDRTERKCKNCTQNTIENEYHFLLVCPLYQDLRRKFLKAYYCSWPTPVCRKSIDSMDILDIFHGIHGYFPQNAWTLSIESMECVDNVHGTHGMCGQCPWNPGTMSRVLWTLSMEFFQHLLMKEWTNSMDIVHCRPWTISTLRITHNPMISDITSFSCFT